MTAEMPSFCILFMQNACGMLRHQAKEREEIFKKRSDSLFLRVSVNPYRPLENF
jgi:hypothetical protein